QRKRREFQPKNYSFIELSTSAPEKAKAILRALGFHSVMVHKSRWAQVWRNGDIYLIMRADSTGKSGIFNLVGIGVDVDDIEGINARAESFQSPRTPSEDFFDEF